MGLLDKHIKKEIRYSSKDFTLYEPSQFQREELTKIVMDNSKIEGDNLTAEYGIDMIRYILKEITNIGEEVNELTNDELEKLIDNGDRDIELLIREITILLEEISDDSIYILSKQVKMMNDLLNTLDANGDVDKLKNKFNKFTKKYKLKMTWEDLMDNKEEQQRLLKELNKQNKELK